MPNPTKLATAEDEERRAWVTAHHEVVRLVKDCFGDRFSNNEIFDRLKISRRTGYRALGNDERIGKAPGRKPKITEHTIRDMIEYIESGGCNDVGNVWKHLAEKFASDCNPKTVQDAVKKSGFKNYRSTVQLEPLLNEEVSADLPAPDDDDDAPLPSQPAQPLHTQPGLVDSSFDQSQSKELLRQAIAGSHEDHVKYLLWQVCNTSPEAEILVIQTLCPFVSSADAVGNVNFADEVARTAKRSRLAICRRCGGQYNRIENTMENRQCLYHKGTIEESPEAYIWSCCGGNGMVRGCCRAMHTTKKKRKHGKKRNAAEAGLDDGDDFDGGDSDELPVADDKHADIDAANDSSADLPLMHEAQAQAHAPAQMPISAQQLPSVPQPMAPTEQANSDPQLPQDHHIADFGDLHTPSLEQMPLPVYVGDSHGFQVSAGDLTPSHIAFAHSLQQQPSHEQISHVAPQLQQESHTPQHIAVPVSQPQMHGLPTPPHALSIPQHHQSMTPIRPPLRQQQSRPQLLQRPSRQQIPHPLPLHHLHHPPTPTQISPTTPLSIQVQSPLSSAGLHHVQPIQQVPLQHTQIHQMMPQHDPSPMTPILDQPHGHQHEQSLQQQQLQQHQQHQPTPQPSGQHPHALQFEVPPELQQDFGSLELPADFGVAYESVQHQQQNQDQQHQQHPQQHQQHPQQLQLQQHQLPHHDHVHQHHNQHPLRLAQHPQHHHEQQQAASE